MMRGMVVACVLLAACASRSHIGPYVKSVHREGGWLIVEKCTISLLGERLDESDCATDRVPLPTVQVAPRCAGAPGTQGLPGQAPAPSSPLMPPRS